MPDETPPSFPTLAGLRRHYREFAAIARTDHSLSGGAMAYTYGEMVKHIDALFARTAGQALTEFIAIYEDHLGPDRCYLLKLMSIDLDDAARPADPAEAEPLLTFPEPLAAVLLSDQKYTEEGDGTVHVTAAHRGYRFSVFLQPVPGTAGTYRVAWLRLRNTRTSETVYVFDGRVEVIPPTSENARRFVQWLFRGLGDPVVPVPSYSPAEAYPWLTPNQS